MKCAVIALCMTLILPELARAQEAAAPLRLILAMPRDTAGAPADALRGMRFGAAEAVRTAALFNIPVFVAEHAAGRAAVLPGSVTVAAGDAGECAHMRAAAAAQDVVLIDAACPPPAEECATHVFRIAPPAGDTRPAAGADSVAGWHADFERYGAAQLNDRYRAEYGTGMTEAAWRGWFAVKVAADAALRVRSGSPAAIRAFLTSPGARFDGHKGRPLRFDAARHLHSPAYAITGGRDVRELPFSLDEEVNECSGGG